MTTERVISLELDDDFKIKTYSFDNIDSYDTLIGVTSSTFINYGYGSDEIKIIKLDKSALKW